MVNKKSQLPTRKTGRLLISMWLLLSVSSASVANNKGRDELHEKLAAAVKDFDSQNSPLIPALLRVAADYKLPMGIEKVVSEALHQPLDVKLRRGTVAQLLDRCVHKVPGYSWTTQDGVILVYGADEFKNPSNLFNFVIPTFEVHDETLNTANRGLFMSLYVQKEKPSSIVGSYPGMGQFEDKRVTLTMRKATVRQILNRLVALHGSAVWMARVPPDRLSQIPHAGLWALLPNSTQNPRGFLEGFDK
jgi:hypothetical protein